MQSAKLGKYTVYFDNSEEYHGLKREVWGTNLYYVDELVEREDQKPLTIIDAGAHIGLATLYFRRIFPEARIVAIEPFPRNAELWRINMEVNQVTNVEIWEGALSVREGEAEFFYDKTEEGWYSTAGLINGAWNESQESARMIVKTRKLESFLESEKPDLVKMDIEGVEVEVVRQTKEKLRLCPHFLIEYHPGEGREMGSIIKEFEEQGFKVTVRRGGKEVEWRKTKGLLMIEAERK